MKNWEKNIRKVVPYTPGEQPKKSQIIKLNTNENPYPPAPGVKEALEHFHTDDLRLYPDPVVTNLVDGIAQFYQVDPSQVFVGVGSDDVLAMLFMTFFNSKKPILFPDITYSFYDVWAEMLRIPYTQIPLDDAFRLNPADYKCENGGIVFPNPNAPTGELLPVSAIEEIVQANPDVIVIVDEAYIDFGGESALPLIDKYDNVIVVQTFSKSRSLAGSRIGFAISNPTLIKYFMITYRKNKYYLLMIITTINKKRLSQNRVGMASFALFQIEVIWIFLKKGVYKLTSEGFILSNCFFRCHKPPKRLLSQDYVQWPAGRTQFQPS